MIEPVYTRVARTKEEAHEAVTLAYAAAKGLVADGKRARVTVEEDQDDVSLRQRKFLHGPVLKQISEQARIDGERYVPAVWKEYFRALFLPDRWVMSKQPRWDAKKGRVIVPRKATPRRVRRSTEDLGVKGYSRHIDMVLAHAATEFGVEFHLDPIEREAVRYIRPEKATTIKEIETC